ncbi:MAG: hypothetical protein JWO60_3141, partial [Frankiales bacterium]|nr:hypothetical protein [Frankiales bacterium]
PGALARVYDVTGAGDPAQAGPPGRRVLLGTVPLTQSLVRPGEGTPYGYRGELETDALEGGARVLLAEVVYSDAALPATGQLDLLVDAPSLTLQASARPEQSGAARLEPGDRVVVDVAAFLGAPGGVRVRSSLQEVPASVELAGPAGRTLTLPVILTPSPLGGLRGQVGFLPGLPGQWRGTVRVTGDGSAFSSGLDTFGFEVFRHATAVTARLVSAGSSAAAPPEGAAPFAAGTSVTVEVAVRRSRVVVPGTPTPAAGTVTVRSGSSPGAPTCTATLGLDGTGRCALPEGALGAGRAVLFLDHAVSALDDASSSQLAVLGERRTTTTSSTLAPVSGADDPVLVGTTVRFSWTVRTAFLAAPGRVEVSDHRGQPLCDGVATVGGTGASTGSCTVTLPASALSGTARDVVRWTARFRPADAVSVASSTGGAEVHGRECVPLTGDALLTFTLLQGDACAVPAGSTAPSLGAHVDAGGVPVAVTRVLTGSRVRASATAPDRYVLRDWRVGGRPVDPTADDAEGTAATRTLGVTFTADGDDDVRFAQVYAPTCYTLTLPASLFSRGALSTNVRQFGTAYVGSYSNCERETDTRPEANGDQVRFAAGTAVTVVIDPDRERVTRAGVPVVGMELASVTGMTLNAPDALTAQSLDTGASSGGVRRLATVVMDADVTVGATFRVAGCLPLTLAAGTGGTLAVTSSSRPDSSAELSPYSGACTARGGTLKGYVPGTYVTVKATPDAAAKYSLHELVLGAASPAQLEAVPLGAPATTVVADTLATRVEPGTAVRARFSRVECVKVTVRLAVNLSTRPDVGVPMPRGERCESMPSIPSTSRTWDGDRYTISESSAWYLRKDGFSVTVDPTQRQTARYPFRLAEPYWTATPGGPQERSSGDSPYVRATAVPAGGSIVLDAVWRTPCRTLRVDVTQGVALLSVRGVETTEPDPDLGFLYCPPGQVADGQGFTLTAAGNPAVSGGPALFPYFSALSDDRSGTSPLRASSARVDEAFYRLLWCRTGGVSVQVRDGAGVLRNATLRELGQLQTDDSGCPNGSLEAGRTSTVRLNPLASELWSQEGPDLQVALDAAGRTAEGKTPKIVFAVRCHRITLGEDTEFVSTPNCPGDGGRFLRGGQVEVAAQVSGGNRLDGWVGIKVAFGEHALLVADQDRFVGADVHHTDWKERFVNGLSNFAQRLVGLGISIASGLLQAEMLLFTGAAALIRGVATGLAALGVDPAIVAGMNQAARYINVVGDTLGMMTDCIGTWSRGGPALTAVPVPEGTGEATDHAIGAATDRVEEATEKSLEAAAKAGSSSAKALGKGVVLIGVGRDVADALGSSVGSYSRPAAQGWSAFAGEIGSCLSAGIEDEVKGLVPMTDQEARDAAR